MRIALRLWVGRLYIWSRVFDRRSVPPRGADLNGGGRMKPGRRHVISSSLLADGACPVPASAQDKAKTSGEPKTVSLRGKVVCLTEELEKLYQIAPERY